MKRFLADYDAGDTVVVVEESATAAVEKKKPT
jgi:hypothetical protein